MSGMRTELSNVKWCAMTSVHSWSRATAVAAAGYGASATQYAQYGAAGGQQPAAGYGAAGMQPAQPQGGGGAYGGPGPSYGASAYQQVRTAGVTTTIVADMASNHRLVHYWLLTSPSI